VLAQRLCRRWSHARADARKGGCLLQPVRGVRSLAACRCNTRMVTAQVGAGHGGAAPVVGSLEALRASWQPPRGARAVGVPPAGPYAPGAAPYAAASGGGGGHWGAYAAHMAAADGGAFGGSRRSNGGGGGAAYGAGGGSAHADGAAQPGAGAAAHAWQAHVPGHGFPGAGMLDARLAGLADGVPALPPAPAGERASSADSLRADRPDSLRGGSGGGGGEGRDGSAAAAAAGAAAGAAGRPPAHVAPADVGGHRGAVGALRHEPGGHAARHLGGAASAADRRERDAAGAQPRGGRAAAAAAGAGAGAGAPAGAAVQRIYGFQERGGSGAGGSTSGGGGGAGAAAPAAARRGGEAGEDAAGPSVPTPSDWDPSYRCADAAALVATRCQALSLLLRVQTLPVATWSTGAALSLRCSTQPLLDAGWGQHSHGKQGKQSLSARLSLGVCVRCAATTSF